MVVLRISGSIDDDTLTGALWDAGCLGLAEQDDRPGEVLAYFDAPIVLEGVLSAGSWQAPDETDYVARYNQDVQPVRIGKVIVAPEHAVLEDCEAPDAIIVRLDPGRAFGSGQHTTTQLALEAVVHYASLLSTHTSPTASRTTSRTTSSINASSTTSSTKSSTNALPTTGTSANLLDVGAGSGILTIAADLLGYQAHGIDIDSETLPVANMNARANASRATFEHASLDTSPAAHYDIIVANIYAHVHAALAADYARALVPGGILLLTGIYQADGLKTTLAGIAPWFDVRSIIQSDTWSLVTATKVTATKVTATKVTTTKGK